MLLLPPIQRPEQVLLHDVLQELGQLEEHDFVQVYEHAFKQESVHELHVCLDVPVHVDVQPEPHDDEHPEEHPEPHDDEHPEEHPLPHEEEQPV